MRRTDWPTTRAGKWASATLVACIVLVRPALAHGGETTGPHDAPLAVVLFLAGVAVLGTSVYLDYRDAIGRTRADAGVFLGIAAVLASIGVYWVV